VEPNERTEENRIKKFTQFFLPWKLNLTYNAKFLLFWHRMGKFFGTRPSRKSKINQANDSALYDLSSNIGYLQSRPPSSALGKHSLIFFLRLLSQASAKMENFFFFSTQETLLPSIE
jgi:hypothetical protein